MEHCLRCFTLTAAKNESKLGSCPFSIDTLMDDPSIQSPSSFSSQSEVLHDTEEFRSVVISIPKMWMWGTKTILPSYKNRVHLWDDRTGAHSAQLSQKPILLPRFEDGSTDMVLLSLWRQASWACSAWGKEGGVETSQQTSNISD